MRKFRDKLQICGMQLTFNTRLQKDLQVRKGVCKHDAELAEAQFKIKVNYGIIMQHEGKRCFCSFFRAPPDTLNINY